jgi:hypothetical protein
MEGGAAWATSVKGPAEGWWALAAGLVDLELPQRIACRGASLHHWVLTQVVTAIDGRPFAFLLADSPPSGLH